MYFRQAAFTEAGLRRGLLAENELPGFVVLLFEGAARDAALPDNRQ